MSHASTLRLRVVFGLLVCGVACDKVTVTTPEPASVSLTSSQVSLSVGESVQLTATVHDESGNPLAGQTVLWTSAQPNVAAVTPGGSIQGIGVGTTVVTARSGSASAAAAVTVGPAVGFGLDRAVVDFTTGIDGRAGPETVLVSGSTVGSTDGLSLTTQYLGSATGWLDVSLSSNSTPSSVVLAADAQGLAAGDYSATVMISAAAAKSQTVQVNLKVTNAPAIGLSRNSARFEVQQGGAAPANQDIAVTNLGGGSLSSLSTSVTYATGQPAAWLSASLRGSVAPTVLSLAVQQGNLGPGTYNATVQVMSSVAANTPVDLPVTLVVAAATNQPRISLTDSVVTIVGTQGQPNAAPFVINISNGGGGILTGLQTAASYATGQPTGWVRANLSLGSAPSALTLTAVTGALVAGTYQASVEISAAAAANSPRYVTVLFTVDPPPTLAIAPATGTFTTNFGGSSPAAQTFAISNAGGGAISGLTTSIQYGSGSGWLSATLATTSTPAALTLNATLGSLAQGTYTATVQVASGNAANSPLSLPVTFTVGPAGPGIRISPTSLLFQAVRGGVNPAPKVASVSNSGGLPLTGLTSSVTGYTGGSSAWLNAVLSGSSAPASVAVSPQTTGLAPGTHTATVSIASAGATNSPQSLAVTVAVPGVSPSVSSVSDTVAVGGMSSSAVSISNAGAGSLSGFTATVSAGASWLTPTFSGTTMTLATSGVGLSPGLHQATVTVKATQDVVGAPVTVSLNVIAAPAILLAPAVLTFADTAGTSGAPSKTVSVTNSGGGALAGLVVDSINYASGAGWLSATLDGTNAPASMTVTANATSLTAGAHTATIFVGSSVSGVTNSPQSVQVTFNVSAPLTPPAIRLTPIALTFADTAGTAAPPSQTVSLTNGGQGSLTGLSMDSISYASGAAWLNATLSGTTAPATLTVTANAISLAPGAYDATVFVSSSASGVTNNPGSVKITFNVTAPVAPPSIGLAPAARTFADTAGTAGAPSQTVAVTNTGGGSLTGLSMDSITYASGTGWLTATLSGTTAPGTLTLNASATSLSQGTYNATVFVGSSASGVTNSPQSVAVTFNVTSPTGIGISASSVADTVSEAPGTPDTATSLVNVTDLGSPMSGLSTAISYGTGTGWLTATLNQTTTPATLTLQSSAGTLTPGAYDAIVDVSSTSAGTTPQSVAVILTVDPAPSISLGGQENTALLFGAVGPNPTPPTQPVMVTNSGGGLPNALTGLVVPPIAFLPATTGGNCTAAGTGWLSATLDQTTSPAVLTVQPSVGALTTGTYCAGVQLTSPTGKNSPQTFTVEFTIP